MTRIAAEFEQVTRVYSAGRGRGDRTALDGVTLTLEHGEWAALLGPNGSGKSTLLRLLATIDHQTGGRISWFGGADRSLAELRRRIGVVFQTPALDRLLTVRENLRLQGELFDLPLDAIRTRTNELARELGLHDRLDDRVGTLSGGLARRADLARAFMTQPELLLLDEPTAGLDPASRDQFMAALERRSESGELTIVMSTHLFSEAERARRVIMLHEGRIVADGSAPDLQRALTGEDALVVRAPASHASTLSEASLSPRIAGAEAVAMAPRSQEEQLHRAVRALVESGVRVSIGPATLGDVYESKTGRSLQQAEAE